MDARIQELKEKINDAQLLLIGIGEDFQYDWDVLLRDARYQEIAQEIEEDARYIWIVPFLQKMILQQVQGDKWEKAYDVLAELVKEKNYFIVSLCMDDRIYNACFDQQRIVTPCGGFRKMQCDHNCSGELVDMSQESYEAVLKYYRKEIPLAALQEPTCEVCGDKLRFNQLGVSQYAEEGYLKQWEAYTKWLQGTVNKKLCVLELGVGLEYPKIIRFPFEKIVYYNQKAFMYRIHPVIYQMGEEIGDRGFGIGENPVDFLIKDLLNSTICDKMRQKKYFWGDIMSSSEEYLDSLLEAILNGGKSNATEESSVQQDMPDVSVSSESPEDNENKGHQTGSANTNKAMSTEEIEEMLMSMGTLGGEKKQTLEEPVINQTDELSLDDHVLEDLNTEEADPEDMQLDSLGMEESGISDLPVENFGTEESVTEDFSLDDLTLDDLNLEEPEMEDLTLDSLAPEETGISDMLIEGQEGNQAALDDFSLDDLTLDDLNLEEPEMEDLTLDSLALEETGISDISMEGQEEDQAALDDFSLDDLTLDDLNLEGPEMDDLNLEGPEMDDLTLDSLAPEETGISDISMEGQEEDQAALDDFSLDDLTLDDLNLEEPEMEDLTLDSLAPEETGISDISMEGEDQAALDDFSLDDLTLDDLNLEEPEMEDLTIDSFKSDAAEMDDLNSLMADMEGELSLDDLSSEEEPMSEEDIDRLLSGEDFGSDNPNQMEDDLAISDDFALEETGAEDDDLSKLLAGMGHDENLSEINDLLEKSDQGGSTDDDMLAMLGEGGNDSFDFFADDNAAKEAASIREISPEELDERENPKGKKEKKRRKKKLRKKKGAEEEIQSENGETDGLESLLEGTQEEDLEKPKKQGFGAKLMALLFEDDDENEKPADAEEDDLLGDGFQMGNLTEENKEILKELEEEDKKGSKKKGKKDKKKKKGKKGKEDAEQTSEEGEEGEEGEQKEKKSRKKKKKKKEVSEEELLAPPEKKLSKKKVMSVFLFCGTIAACIILVSSFLPNYLQKQDARIAYDHGYYGDVYDLLYGKKLNEEDKALFQKSSLILQMDRKLTSYENYNKMGMRLEALDALISGMARYQQLLPKAEEYNVSGEVRERYDKMVEILTMDFGISEIEALDIIAAEDDVTYSQKLQAIIDGSFYGDGEQMPEMKQDVLPEEEEIISRLEGMEQADGSDN